MLKFCGPAPCGNGRGGANVLLRKKLPFPGRGMIPMFRKSPVSENVDREKHRMKKQIALHAPRGAEPSGRERRTGSPPPDTRRPRMSAAARTTEKGSCCNSITP